MFKNLTGPPCHPLLSFSSSLCRERHWRHAAAPPVDTVPPWPRRLRRVRHQLPCPFPPLALPRLVPLLRSSSTPTAASAQLVAVASVHHEQIDADRKHRLELLSLHAPGIGPGSPEPTQSSSPSSTAATTRRGPFPSTPSFPAVADPSTRLLVSSSSDSTSSRSPSPSPAAGHHTSSPPSPWSPPSPPRPEHRPGLARRPADSGLCPAWHRPGPARRPAVSGAIPAWNRPGPTCGPAQR